MIMGFCGDELSLYVQSCAFVWFSFLFYVLLIILELVGLINGITHYWRFLKIIMKKIDGENTPRTKAAKTYGGIVALCLSLAVP